MKTSKVKAITEVKTWNGPKGTVYYHNVEMENGDKLNIGKASQLNIGDELTYEFTGDLGQHEYTKAKSVQPQQQSYSKGFKKGSSNASFALSYAKDWCGILHNAGQQMNSDHVLACADKFLQWLNDNE